MSNLLRDEIFQFGYSIIQNWETQSVIQRLLNNLVNSGGQLTSEVFDYWTNGRLPLLMTSILGKKIYAHTCNIRNKIQSNFSVIPYHQDSAYILPSSLDNQEFFQITCWLPLVDVFEDNGTIEIVKNFENKQVEHILKNGYMQIYESMKSTPLILKAGTLVLMHHNLIHGSNVNKTNSVRWNIDFRYQNIQIPFHNMKQGFQIYPNRELNFLEYLQRKVRLTSSDSHNYSLIK